MPALTLMLAPSPHGLARLHHFQEQFHDLWVEQDTRVIGKVLQHILFRPGFAVWAVPTQRVPHVNYGENARRQGNFLAFQPLRVARPIPTLVVTVRNDQRRLQVGDAGEQVAGEDRDAGA